MNIKCKLCKTPFTPKTYGQKYCSATCQTKYNNQTKLYSKIDIRCENCGDLYSVSYQHYSGRMKDTHQLCKTCRAKTRNKLNITTEPNIKLTLHCPKTVKWKETSLLDDAKNFPGLVFPEAF